MFRKLKGIFRVKSSKMPFRTDKEVKLYLYALSRNPHGYTLAEASRYLKWGKSTVKDVTDRLISKGIIQQVIGENGDKRYVVSNPVRLGLMLLYVTPYKQLPFTLFLASFMTFMLIALYLVPFKYEVLKVISFTITWISAIAFWAITYLVAKNPPI